jgi:tripartite-type tricarboxylate transporter receptor subunit TctC
MNWRRTIQIGMLLLLWQATSSAPSNGADSYPSKPVRIITQAPAGNGPDVIARIVADRLGRLWGQQVVMMNRPGAGGLLAAQAAVAAEADGYTLYQAITSSMLILPVTQSLPFDMQRDFVPIGHMGEQPFLVAVSPSLGVSTLQELIALAKQRPGEILAACAARGSMPHLAAELLRSRAGIDLTLVPYPPTSQALQDLMGGRISVIFESLAGLKGAVDAGTVRPIAVTSPARLPNLPNLPTVAESFPNYAASGWFVLMAPAHTSDAIVRKINNDLRTTLNEPELKRQFEQLGTYTRPMSASEAAEFIKAEQKVWQPLARKFIASK